MSFTSTYTVIFIARLSHDDIPVTFDGKGSGWMMAGHDQTLTNSRPYLIGADRLTGPTTLTHESRSTDVINRSLAPTVTLQHLSPCTQRNTLPQVYSASQRS